MRGLQQAGQCLEAPPRSPHCHALGLDHAWPLLPQAIVDIATLTGACMIALGNGVGGMYASTDALAAQLQEASTASGAPPVPAAAAAVSAASAA